MRTFAKLFLCLLILTSCSQPSADQKPAAAAAASIDGIAITVHIH
jgi:hypothetical protein